MMRARLICIVLMFTLLAGCAYAFRGANEALMINTRFQDLEVSSRTLCKGQNDLGVWTASSSDPLKNTIEIHRSSGVLQVNCNNGLQEGSKQIAAQFDPSAYLFFDLLFGVFPFTLVDLATGSFYSYGNYSEEYDAYTVPLSMNRAHYDMSH